MLQALPQGYAAGAFPPRVEFSGRRSRSSGADFVCLGIFFLGVVAFLGCGFYLVSAKNLEIDSSGVTISDELQAELSACTARATSLGRRLEEPVEANCDLWCVFAGNVQVPVVTIISVPLIGAAWITLLYYFSRAITWGCILFNIVLFVLIGVTFITDGVDNTVGFMFIGFAAVLLLIAFVTRNKIDQAARHLRTACLALSHNLSVFAAAGVLELLMLGFLGLYWFFMVQAAQIAVVEEVYFGSSVSCNIVSFPPIVNRISTFLSIFLVWIIAYINTAKLVTTAMTIGAWFFGQEDKPKWPAFSALGVSLTTSSGAISIGSLITAIVENIVRKATSYFWWTNPLGCFLKCLFIILQGCILALTRFAVVSHAFTGEGFFPSSRRVYEVLKRNFVGGYVLSRVGVAVINTGANALSLCIGLIAWFWIDQENNWNTLSDVTSLFGGIAGFVGFVLLYLFFTRRPLITICIITLFMDTIVSWFSFPPEIFAPIAGVFVSCVAMIILTFQGDVVLDALDSVFLAYAVGKESNLGKPEASGQGVVYALMVEDVPEAKFAGMQTVSMNYA